MQLYISKKKITNHTLNFSEAHLLAYPNNTLNKKYDRSTECLNNNYHNEYYRLKKISEGIDVHLLVNQSSNE